MAQKIQMRRDSVENWLDVNPILARGEWGVAFDGTSTDVIAIKIGDGESDWESLQSLLPINSSDTGGGGLVADAINDGTTTVAPSQNAVFDALALKITNPGGANDDFLQRKAGAWTSRTPAQVKADMSIGVGDVSGFDEQVRDVVGTALAIGEQFLDSVYVPTSGPLVDLATGMELEVETPEVLTLTGNTVHVRSVDQDHTGKTILVECTLVDQHDRTGRRLKGFEMVGTASDAYSLALTLNGSLTPLDGSAWKNGHREDLGIHLGSSGKAVAELSDIANGPATAPFSRSAQFTSPIPSYDLDDHRISIIVTTGLNPTFNGVIETKFEVVPIWEDANESYTPSQPSVWEDIDSIPENKNEALDLLADAIDGLNGGVWRTGTSGQTWPAGARTAFIFADTEDDPFTATLLAPARDGDSIDVFRADTSANELRILPSVDHTFASGDPYITLAVGEHVRLTWDTEGDRWFIAGS